KLRFDHPPWRFPRPVTRNFGVARETVRDRIPLFRDLLWRQFNLQRGDGIRLLFDLDFHEGKRPYAAPICRANAPGCRRLRWQATRLPYNSNHTSRTHKTSRTHFLSSSGSGAEGSPSRRLVTQIPTGTIDRKS